MGRAHPHLCVFGWRAWILHNTVFENRPNFAETAENVAPKWRGRQCNFCTTRSEIGRLRSGGKLVPINFSFHSTSFPIHLQDHKEKSLMFLSFPLLENMPLSFILMTAFCCAINTCVSHGSLQFLCSCWLSLWFLLVPVFLIIFY